MKPAKAAIIPVVLLFAVSLAHGKPKKSNVSALFENARYVYVESVDGDALKPSLYPGDRQAIFDVQDCLREWKRYALTERREQADLVFVVRKGRIAGQQDHIGLGPRPQSTQPGVLLPGQAASTAPSQRPGMQQPPGAGQGLDTGIEAEVGPPADFLRIYTLNPQGKLIGPVWSRSMDDGLDAPRVLLVQQLRNAVDHAFPPETAQQAPATQPAAPQPGP